MRTKRPKDRLLLTLHSWPARFRMMLMLKVWGFILLTLSCANGCTWMKTQNRESLSSFQILSNSSIFHLEQAVSEESQTVVQSIRSRSYTAILPFSRTSRLYRDCSSIYYLFSPFSALVQRFCAWSLRTQHGISTQALQPHFSTTGKWLFQWCWYFLHSNLKLSSQMGNIFFFMPRLFSHIHLKE